MVWTEVGRSLRRTGRCKKERSGDGDDPENDKKDFRIEDLTEGGRLSTKSMKKDFESGDDANGSTGWKRLDSSELVEMLVGVKGPPAVIQTSVISDVPSSSRLFFGGELLNDR